MKKILASALVLATSMVASVSSLSAASTPPPLSLTDVKANYADVRGTSYSENNPICNRYVGNKQLLKTFADALYTKFMSPMEAWRAQGLSPEQQKEYDAIKKIFITERTSPDVPSVMICDKSIQEFVEKLREIYKTYTPNARYIKSELPTEWNSLNSVSANIKTFNSSLGTVAVVKSNAFMREARNLQNYNYVVRVNTNSKNVITNSIVYVRNSAMDMPVGNELFTVAVSPMLKNTIFNKTSNDDYLRSKELESWGGPKAVKPPMSQKIGNNYFLYNNIVK